MTSRRRTSTWFQRLRAKRTAPLLISGAVIHVLPAGSQFDLTSRTLIAHHTPAPDPEVLEARAAEADIREVARDIAAEEVSPANYAPVGCAVTDGADTSLTPPRPCLLGRGHPLRSPAATGGSVSSRVFIVVQNPDPPVFDGFPTSVGFVRGCCGPAGLG